MQYNLHMYVKSEQFNKKADFALVLSHSFSRGPRLDLLLRKEREWRKEANRLWELYQAFA